MRLRQLALLRYGKFTDTVLAFPRAEVDFHVIVGPNEAGKSTLRCAVHELLFGLPRSSPLAFVHRQSELRLGAIVEDGAGAQLAFHRSKSSKAPLRTPADEPLAEGALQTFLGTVERAFFEQMFGLDHAQLVRGGQSILDASKDVGQVLFQAAAGIAGLGRLKDALLDEADKLWAPRKSNERAYYLAAADLERASAELQAVTVRTRAWTQAQSACADIDSRVEQARTQRAHLERARASRERVRRLAPAAQALHAKRSELDALGEVLDLPADAAVLLGEGQATLAEAQLRLQHLDDDVMRRREERHGNDYDAAVLTAQADIEALEACRHRVGDHSGDLALRRQEIQQRLQAVSARCVELGWSSGEAQVRAMLPSSLARRAVMRLAASYGTLLLAQANAARIVKDSQTEIESLRAALAASSEVTVPAGLPAALAHGQGLRNSAQRQRELAAALATAERAQHDALRALAPWQGDPQALGAMGLPSRARVSALRDARQTLVITLRASEAQVAEAAAKVEDARLAVAHYAAARSIVTSVDVQSARAHRDQTWAAVKDGNTPLASGAPVLDAAITLADRLADTQLGSTAEAAELLSRQQRHEREVLAQERLVTLVFEQRQALQNFDQAWADQTQCSGLPSMVLDDFAAWLAQREAALAAGETLASRQREVAAEQRAALEAATALHGQLDGGDSDVDRDLAALCGAAEQKIRDADTAGERRQSLTLRVAAGERALRDAQDKTTTAAQACRDWDQQWAAALVAAGLSGRMLAVADAEAALELVASIAADLDEVDKLRRDRIDPMERDLERFQALGAELVARLDPSLAAETATTLISQTLFARLQQAQTAYQRWFAADAALTRAEQQRDDAALQVDATVARLRPLLDAAGAISPAQALPLVIRSDRKRELVRDVEQLRDALTRDADGLDLRAVLTEIESSDLTLITSELRELESQLASGADAMQTLAGERVRAEQALASIGGQADAAIAAAKRQEALAAMADTAERYLKVRTASLLLRWAIAKYRDRKQGPMLARAGRIFAELTLGSYTQLQVDYDQDPPRLGARHRSGRDVEVAGLSEGTRDQLYLALRLAALELHLAQATPLPFVADDLFINFDDARATAGFQALRGLAQHTQVIFLSHHDHLLAMVREVFGADVNVIELVA